MKTYGDLAAALQALYEQQQTAEREHLVRQDNLAASVEALEMACQLVAQQMQVSDQVRQRLLSIQRSYIHGQ